MVAKGFTPGKNLTLVDCAKTIQTEYVRKFALEYLERTCYIKSKNLTGLYLERYYNLSRTSQEYKAIFKILKQKFVKVIRSLKNKGLIYQYNNTGTWKLNKIKSYTVFAHVGNGRFVNPDIQD